MFVGVFHENRGMRVRKWNFSSQPCYTLPADWGEGGIWSQQVRTEAHLICLGFHSLTNFRPLCINANGTVPPAYFVYFANLLKSVFSSLMVNSIVFKRRMHSFCYCKRTASQEELFRWFWSFLIFGLIGEIVILTKLAENMPWTAHTTRGDTFHEAIYSVDKGFLGHFWHCLYTYLKMSFSMVNSTSSPSLSL